MLLAGSLWQRETCDRHDFRNFVENDVGREFRQQSCLLSRYLIIRITISRIFQLSELLFVRNSSERNIANNFSERTEPLCDFSII